MLGLRSNFRSFIRRRRTLLRSPTAVLPVEGRSRTYDIKFMDTIEYFVYILRSIKYPQRLYIGLTRDVAEHLKEHNTGISKYSKAYAPWELEVYICLKDKESAENLEKYLKSGSGFAFLKKRLLPKVISKENYL